MATRGSLQKHHIKCVRETDEIYNGFEIVEYSSSKRFVHEIAKRILCYLKYRVSIYESER